MTNLNRVSFVTEDKCNRTLEGRFYHYFDFLDGIYSLLYIVFSLCVVQIV